MAPTNIELYEALKKDVSEESARMIAEAVPKAENIATREDVYEAVAELRTEMIDRFSTVFERFNAMEVHFERRFAEAERRTFRYAMIFGAPLWAAMIAALVKIVLKV
jgi:hypothetical protein